MQPGNPTTFQIVMTMVLETVLHVELKVSLGNSCPDAAKHTLNVGKKKKGGGVIVHTLTVSLCDLI